MPHSENTRLNNYPRGGAGGGWVEVDMSLSTLGDRSFYMAAPKLWNDLPLFIRNISSVNAFKKALKTHLFQKAFPS